MSRLTERLERALQQGGVAYPTQKAFDIYRSPDRRRMAIGQLPRSIGEGLIQRGLLKEVKSTGAGQVYFVWAGAVLPERNPTPETLDLSIFRPAFAHHPRRGASLLERMATDRTPLCPRLAGAAKRFLSEAEQAASGPSLTTNWAAFAAPVDASRCAKDGPDGRHARALSAMRRLEKHLGTPMLGVLDMLIVRQLSRASLARRLGSDPKTAERQARQALISLADAYDRLMPSTR